MITKVEIKALVFSNNFDINAIKDNVIFAIETTVLLPILGSDLFDDIEANPQNYVTLLSYIKPMLAWEIRKATSHTVTYKLGNKGAMEANGVNESPTDVIEVKREAEKFASTFRNLTWEWLRKNKPALWKPTKETDFVNKIIIM